jgi:insulysin
MKLVLLGSQPIDQLEKWALDLFSTIENKNLSIPAYHDLPFDKSNLGRFVKLVPVNDGEYLSIKWLIGHLHPHYKVEYYSVISI